MNGNRHPRKGAIVWESDPSGEAVSLAPSGFTIVKFNPMFGHVSYRLMWDGRFICQRQLAREAKREAEEMWSDWQIAGVAS